MSIRRRGGKYAGLVFSLSLLVAAVGLGSCGGEMEEEPQPVATERCKAVTDTPAGSTGVNAEAGDENEVSCEGDKLAKKCRPNGKSCSSGQAGECCSLACVCPLGSKKCTCG